MKFNKKHYKIVKINGVDSGSVWEFLSQFKEEQQLNVLLLKLMQDKGLTAPEVYHRAELDRQIFNKLIQSKPVRASKATLLKIAIGLRATEGESRDILAAGGYAFQLTSPVDAAYLYCIQKEKYSIPEVEAAEYIISRYYESGRDMEE